MLAESASSIILCDVVPAEKPLTEEHHKSLNLPSLTSLSNMFSRSRTPSPEPTLTALPPPPVPRRMVILVVGIKPHRMIWSTSARPSESVLNYILLNGCPAIVIPVKLGAPLVAWDGLTLEKLWRVELPLEGVKSSSGQFEGIISVLFEYLDLCTDWQRVTLGAEGAGDDDSKAVLKSAITLLVAAAIRSEGSKQVKKEIDNERSGIAMWRIP